MKYYSGFVTRARIEAAEFLEATLATDEHTYGALAYETNARLAIAEQYFSQAQDFLTKALESTEGLKVPLAHWPRRLNSTNSLGIENWQTVIEN